MSEHTGLAALYASTGAAWSRTLQERGTEISFLAGCELVLVFHVLSLVLAPLLEHIK